MHYNDIHNRVTQAFTVLPSRYQSVLMRRFGITSAPHTLEAIGRDYGITRERVRQIIVKGFNDLTRSEKSELLFPIVKWTEEQIRAEGGIVPEAWFLEEYGKDKKGALYFILHFGEEFSHKAGDTALLPRWYVDSESHSKAIKEIRALEDHLAQHKRLIPHQEVLTFLSHPNYIRISKRILRSVLGNYGLSHWPEVVPRGIKDKAYLVLLLEKKPLHFSEITERINALPLGSRKALKQTVHNELIKDKRFILVGRGLYALKDWGFKKGTVRDILYTILKEKKKPLAKQELVDLVLKERFVQPNTIILNLNEHNGIVRLANGKYTIAESS